jgi:hypothetical protein
MIHWVAGDRMLERLSEAIRARTRGSSDDSGSIG